MKSNSLLLLLLAVLYSCSEDRFIGSGDTISEVRHVEYFNEVSSEGTFEVTIYKGTEQSLEIIADNNIMSRVKTDVVNGRLKLKLSEGNYSNLHLKAIITVLDLKKISNSGVGDMSVYNMEDTENLKAVNSGSANIVLEGNCETLEIENEGSGSVYAFEMLSQECIIDNVGSGEIEVHCQSNLVVNIEGSGDVYYKGYPMIEIDIQGSGSLINEN